MGISYLYETFKKEIPAIAFINNLDSGQVGIVLKMLESGFNSPVTSSCGRLFDGVAAIAGLRNVVNYEGQAAVEFEQRIDEAGDSAYEFRVTDEQGELILDWRPVIKQVLNDVKNDTPRGRIALKFHNGIAFGLTLWAEIARRNTGLNNVALSGGVFMNIYLLNRLKKSLEKKGFNVYTHSIVPCNDGGISPGQVVIADAQMKNRGKTG